jgi:hypothetical protein
MITQGGEQWKDGEKAGRACAVKEPKFVFVDMILTWRSSEGGN